MLTAAYIVHPFRLGGVMNLLHLVVLIHPSLRRLGSLRDSALRYCREIYAKNSPLLLSAQRELWMTLSPPKTALSIVAVFVAFFSATTRAQSRRNGPLSVR